MRWVVLTIFFLFSIFSLFAFAQFGENVEFLGNALITGTYHDVVISGNYAYIADSYGISILNISNPDTLELLSTLATPGGSRVLALSGNYAFIGDELFGLIVADVSDPFSPQIAGYYSIGYWQVSDIFIQGNLLYLTVSTAGLYVFDITNPSSPVVANIYTAPNFDAHGVFVIDSLAYVADYWDGLAVINVKQLSHIFQITELELPDRSLDVWVEGNYAYVVAADSGMRVVDVSHLNNLQEVASYNFGLNPANKIHVQNNIAFISYNGSGLHLVNVSDPIHPVNMSIFFTADVRGVFPSNSLAYIANGYKGLSVVDISNPFYPFQRSEYRPNAGTSLGVCKSGNTVYVTGEQRLICSIDITTPLYPTVNLDWFWSGFNGVDIVVRDTLAYIAGHLQGLMIMNVADPTVPTLVGAFDTPGAAYGIAVQGNFAYVADGDSGLRIIDISNPTQPQEIGSYNSIRATKLTVAGNYAYLVHPAFGLYILNISDPSHPSMVGQLSLGGWTTDIQVVGGLAFLASNDLTIVDIADPAQPQLINYLVLTGGPRSVFVEDIYAYLLTDYGLFIVDVSDVNHLVKVGSYNVPGYGYDIFVENKTIYVADYYDFEILRFNPPSTIEPINKKIPSHTFLYQNYPNPFNPSTIIEFDLPQSGKVTLTIYDVLGEQVDKTSWENLTAGYHRYQWNGEGRASGVYIYKLETETYVTTRKMLLMR